MGNFNHLIAVGKWIMPILLQSGNYHLSAARTFFASAHALKTLKLLSDTLHFHYFSNLLLNACTFDEKYLMTTQIAPSFRQD